MLLFKKKFIEPILRGEKTQTIRLWKRRRMKPGQRSYIPGVGYVSIGDVEPVELDALTDADAVPDGFATADLLRKEIRLLYADEIAAGLQAYRVRFIVCSPEEQQRFKEEKRQRKAAEEARLSDEDRKAFVDDTLEKLRAMAKKNL